MTTRPQPWMMPYLSGRCYDFALALGLDFVDPEFVALGGNTAQDQAVHVGIRYGDMYLDVRGVLSETDFFAHHGGPAIAVDRSVIEFWCGLGGVEPPYEGSDDIAEARTAVKRAFPQGIEYELDLIDEGAFAP